MLIVNRFLHLHHSWGYTKYVVISGTKMKVLTGMDRDIAITKCKFSPTTVNANKENNG